MCWYKIGSPPPEGSKNVVPKFLSVRSIVIAPASTGRANKINHAVYQQLKRLENGKISQPFRYANIIAITKLIKWNQIQLGETMKSTLEADLLESWLQEQVAKIVQHIEQTN